MLKWSNLCEQMRSNLAERYSLRSNLQATKKFKLASNAIIDKYDSQELKETTGCKADNCALIVGKRLGVDQVIYTSFAHVEKDLYLLTSMLINTLDSSIHSSFSLKIDKESDLTPSLEKISKLLANTDRNKSKLNNKSVFPIKMYFVGKEFKLNMTLDQLSDRVVEIRKKDGVLVKSILNSDRISGNLLLENNTVTSLFEKKVSLSVSYSEGKITGISKIIDVLPKKRQNNYIVEMFDNFSNLLKKGTIELGDPKYFKKDEEAVWKKNGFKYSIRKEIEKENGFSHFHEEIFNLGSEIDTSKSQISNDLWELTKIDFNRIHGNNNIYFDSIIVNKNESSKEIKTDCSGNMSEFSQEDLNLLLAEIDKRISKNATFQWFYCKGKIFNMQKNYLNAIEEFSNAIYYEPEYSKIFKERGIAQVGLKNYEKAITDFEKSVSIVRYRYRNRSDNKLVEFFYRNDLKSSLYYLAMTYLLKPRTNLIELSKAESYLEEVIEIFPDFGP